MCPFDDDDELNVLKPKAIKLWHTHQSVLSERDALAARVKELEAQVAKSNRARFGTSSERSKPEDKPAGADATAGQSANKSEDKPKPEHKGHGRREQPHLTLETVEHKLEGDALICEHCGDTLERFEAGDEVSREIDVLRRRFRELEHRRWKYRCRCGMCVRTAPPPLKLKAGNLYSIAFGVHAAALKYDQHQPLVRQARVMQAEGLRIDDQTIWDQVDSVAFWSQGAYRAIKLQVLTAQVVGADETTWRLMDTTDKAKTHTSKWWVWGVRAPNAVFYHLDESRSADAGAKLLADYHGVVMCDGYIAYVTLAARYPDLLLAHCWSHIRRDFFEIENQVAGASEGMLRLIDELFAIDSEANKLGEVLLAQATSEGERALAAKGAEAMLLAARTERSSKVLERLRDKSNAIRRSQPEDSALCKACTKMEKQWEGLTLFVKHAKVPLHNNAMEQSHRGPVSGRNNHQGSRSKRGTEVSAILYTLVESAKLAGVDPERYLLLCVRRRLMDKVAVTPSEVTVAMLMEDCELSAQEAQAALAG